MAVENSVRKLESISLSWLPKSDETLNVSSVLRLERFELSKLRNPIL